ncbi:MAG: hypothetical protein ACE1Y4_16180 [Lysobacterales bacterium]
MQVAIHLGAHCTDEDRLLKTLLQNKGRFAKDCISIPGPGRYRITMVRAAQKLRGAQASGESRDVLLDTIVDDDSAQRVVLSHENFICVPGRIFENGILYDKAEYKPLWLRQLFPGLQVEFFLGIRNPATFIPAVFYHPGQETKKFENFLDGVDLDQVRWSDVILSIRETNPDCPLTVWCNEDTPLIWPQVIQEVSGHDPSTQVNGAFAVLGKIMKREGMQRLRTYLGTHPPQNEIQRRRILVAFLDKYALEDEVEEELDVPGWTEALVHALTQNYEDDLDEIGRMPGVNFISP